MIKHERTFLSDSRGWGERSKWILSTIERLMWPTCSILMNDATVDLSHLVSTTLGVHSVRRSSLRFASNMNRKEWRSIFTFQSIISVFLPLVRFAMTKNYHLDFRDDNDIEMERKREKQFCLRSNGIDSVHTSFFLFLFKQAEWQTDGDDRLTSFERSDADWIRLLFDLNTFDVLRDREVRSSSSWTQCTACENKERYQYISSFPPPLPPHSIIETITSKDFFPEGYSPSFPH